MFEIFNSGQADITATRIKLGKGEADDWVYITGFLRKTLIVEWISFLLAILLLVISVFFMGNERKTMLLFVPGLVCFICWMYMMFSNIILLLAIKDGRWKSTFGAVSLGLATTIALMCFT